MSFVEEFRLKMVVLLLFEDREDVFIVILA